MQGGREGRLNSSPSPTNATPPADRWPRGCGAHREGPERPPTVPGVPISALIRLTKLDQLALLELDDPATRPMGDIC